MGDPVVLTEGPYRLTVGSSHLQGKDYRRYKLYVDGQLTGLRYQNVSDIRDDEALLAKLIVDYADYMPKDLMSTVTPGGRVVKHCYAIVGGSYSDYRVYAVFRTKAAAEAALAAHQEDPGSRGSWSRPDRVEVLPFYSEGDAPLLITTYEMEVRLWDDGTVESEVSREYREWEYDQAYVAPPRPLVRFNRPPVMKDRGGRLEVRGTDQQAVAQAFGDNKARIQSNIIEHGKAELR